jgi:hypothetical protein
MGAQVCASDGSCWGPCECTGFVQDIGECEIDVCPESDKVNLTISVPEPLPHPPSQLIAFWYSTDGWTFPPQRPPDGGTDYNQVMNPDIDYGNPYVMQVPGCTYYREAFLEGDYYLFVGLLMEESPMPIPGEGDYWWGMDQTPTTFPFNGIAHQATEIEMEVTLVPVADLPPEITSGPVTSMDLTPLSTNSEEPTTVRADQSIIWTWSDYMLGCTSDPTIRWEYKPLGSGPEDWTTYTIQPDQQGGGAQKPDAWTDPMGMLGNGTFEFRISMTDCAEQTTVSDVFYIVVDMPPEITGGPVRTSDETPLSTDPANPTPVESNDSAIFWIYNDDYVSCQDVSPPPRTLQWSYRPLGSGDWTTYTVYPDGQGGGTFWGWVWADTTVITESETVEFKVSVTDCTDQTTESEMFYITVVEVDPPEKVSPVLECVDDNGDGTYTAYFGYNNMNNCWVHIPVGIDNKFTPDPQDRGQTQFFEPGRVVNDFSVVFDGSNLVWYLKSPNSEAATSTASDNPDQRCD